MRDDLLRMLLLCCDERVPGDSQLALALKTLCGFDVAEIAERLFTTEANVYKRLARARDRLREDGSLPDALEPARYASRLGRVHEVLYPPFTEGYLSSHAELAIRREPCDEALRLATLLLEHPVGDTPNTSALVALFHLHAARLSSRLAGSYLWSATLADLHLRAGHVDEGAGHRDAALDGAPSPAVRDALDRRLRAP